MKGDTPAFPCEYFDKESFDKLKDDLGLNAARQLTSKAPGMTLRDYFAAAALPAIVAKQGGFSPETAARQAYKYATAMMMERGL